MKLKEEIAFWKKAHALILKGYGGRHSHKPIDMDFRCASCMSGLAASWVDMHIDLLKWNEGKGQAKALFKKVLKK